MKIQALIVIPIVIAIQPVHYQPKASSSRNESMGNPSWANKNSKNKAGKPDWSKGTPKVQSISFKGDGCPPNSVGASFSEDFSALTVIFDDFIAYTGSSSAETMKRCSIDINLHYPDNISYAVSSVIYRGFASIPEGTTGTLSSRYNFRGNPNKAERDYSFSNYDGDYTFISEVPESEIEWSKCRQIVSGRINTKIQIKGDKSNSALLTVDSVDGKATQTFKLNWKTCQ